MKATSRNNDDTQQVLIVGLGGVGSDVIQRLVARDVMPRLASVLPSSARADLGEPFFASPMASWASLQTGRETCAHGVLDEYCLEHRRQRLVRTRAAGPADEVAVLSDAGDSPAVVLFRGPPGDEGELERGLARAVEIIADQFSKARAEIAATQRRVIVLKLTVFDSLVLRLGQLLGIGDEVGGRRSWIANVEQLFRALDEELASLIDLAAERRFALAVGSPYRFVPFRGKILVNELLRREGLLHLAEGWTRWRYEHSRFLERQQKQLGLRDRGAYLLTGLLPIDWHRTRAVSLHGENAAFVYLVTRERFAAGPITTASEREESTAEVLAALAGAKQPISEEPLFQEVFSTAERFGIDPVEKRWPEIIGIPSAGYQIRQRFAGARQLVRPDASVAAARAGGGFFYWQAVGAVAGDCGRLSLSEVTRCLTTTRQNPM
jgi:predicted AlkP superfamily phosphohydrolase/phosphomutase